MPDREENRMHSGQRCRKVNPLPFVLICAAIVLFVSFLFRVSTIEVVGSTVYSNDEVVAASGIQVGDSLFFINRSSAVSHILSKLPAVDNASVERVMPNRIRINVTESDSIAYIDVQGQLWSLDHSMRFLEKIGEDAIAGKIQIKGIQADSPIIGTQVDSDRSEQLSQMMETMTAYSMLPYVNWIELETDGTAEFDYLGRFTVKMPLDDQLDYNFQKLLNAVSQLSPGDRALLDLSQDDKVHYIPR